MSINFGARVRLKDYKTVRDTAFASDVLSGASSVTVGSGAMAATSAIKTAGFAANTVGSAFSAKASGINSSGIVPAVVESATPYVTPATIASSEAHPSLMGSFFSSVGGFFHSLVKVNVKKPSK